MIKNFICEKTRIKIQIQDNGIILGEYNQRLTQHNDAYGYKYITLKHSPNRKNYKVHKLVALVFINNSELKPDVNHKDGNKTNNHVNNLEWVTKSENMKHAVKIGLVTNCTQKGDNHNVTKIPFNQVLKIREMYSSNKYSMRDLAKSFDCSSGCISDIINLKTRVNE